MAEVVSPSAKTEDYRAKRIEYCVLDIPEYWIVDLVDHCVTICVFEEGSYIDFVLMDDTAIASPIFPNLQLTATQILAGKREE